MKRRKVSVSDRSGFTGIALIVITALVIVGAVIGNMYRKVTVCANNISCIIDMSGEFQPGRTSTYQGRIIDMSPQVYHDATGTRVLGKQDTTEEKHIVVNLSTQRLTAYEDNDIIMSFPVATGRWFPTPTGEFRIWVKLRYTHMEGGNKDDGTYYNLYNVPYTMFFYNNEIPKSRGFGLHGAYWHNNFGHPMSHGCVNIRPEDAGKLYDWVGPVTDGRITYASTGNPGTRLTIVGTTAEE